MVLKIKEIVFSFDTTMFLTNENIENKENKDEHRNVEDNMYRMKNISIYQMMTQQELYVRVTIGAWTVRTRSRTFRRADSLQWLDLDLSVLIAAETLDLGSGLLVELINSNMSLDDVVVGRSVVSTNGLLGKIFHVIYIIISIFSIIIFNIIIFIQGASL